MRELPQAELSLAIGCVCGLHRSEGDNATDIVDGARIDVGVSHKSSFSWSIDYGYFANEKFQIGALFAQQNSDLQFSAANNAFIGVPEKLERQQHPGNLRLQHRDLREKARVYFLGGLGVTRTPPKI